jgi:modulator of FtsH protease HflK
MAQPPPVPTHNLDPLGPIRNLLQLPRKLLIGLVVAFFTLITVLSIYYTVPTDSAAVVQRFGKLARTTDPGIHFKLPWGIETVTIVPVRRELKLEFGHGSATATNRFQFSNEQIQERQMVTGDRNAAEVKWSVYYRISDPVAYLFKPRAPEETLRAASESVMREVIGDRTIDEVITIGRQDIENSVKIGLETLSERYELGMEITLVQLTEVDPPPPVRASFNEVNESQQERESTINQAKGEYNRAVPRTRGEAERLVSEAEGYAIRRVNEAEGDVSRFNALFYEFASAPEATRTRLYLETMAKILPALGSKTIIDENLEGILPLLNIDRQATSPAQ